MDIPRSLETLSSVIDSLEAAELRLNRFRLRERDLVADGEVVADVEVEASLGDALDRGDLEIEDVRTGSADTLTVEMGSITSLLPPACREHFLEVNDVELVDGSTLELDLAVSIPIDSGLAVVGGDGAGSTSSTAIAFEAYRDESVPPFDDIPYLQAIYDACETFDEMRELIDLNVTTETVRRYMIDAGVHQPNSYETGDGEVPASKDSSSQDAGEDEVDVILADGIGIPEEVTIEEFITTVRRSKTLHEVQQSMGLRRDEAYDILADLNLLDLVVGRLAMESERDVTRDEVIERLRRSAA